MSEVTPEKQKTVQISAERFAELVKAEKMLDALQAAGVDNWEGYADAMELVEP